MIPEEYVKDFENRFNLHRSLVFKYGRILVYYLDNQRMYYESQQLLYDIENHDSSKFSKEEREGYIWINAHYNLGIEYPNEEVKQLADSAWDHHKLVNDHHPEFWSDCNEMTINVIAHMVSDWKAMEFINDNSMKLREFWTKVGSKKYDWDDKHRSWIEDFINRIIIKHPK